jgi:hypothetical protein
LLILIEGFLDFAIAFVLYTIYDPLKQNVTSMLIAIAIVLLTFILLPLTMLRVIFQDKSVLQTESYNQRFGVLYEELKIQSRYDLSFHLIFILRRLIFTFICLYMRSASYFQIMFLEYLNLALMIYLGNNQPFRRPFKNKVEVVNEVLIMIATNVFMCFSDFVPD